MKFQLFIQKLKLIDTTSKQIHTFLVVSYESLGDGLSDGIDLGDVSTTVDTDPDVYSREFLFAEQKDWLKKLQWENITSLGLLTS